MLRKISILDLGLDDFRYFMIWNDSDVNLVISIVMVTVAIVFDMFSNGVSAHALCVAKVTLTTWRLPGYGIRNWGIVNLSLRPYSVIAIGWPASDSLAEGRANESLAGYPKAITEYGLSLIAIRV